MIIFEALSVIAGCLYVGAIIAMGIKHIIDVNT